ncbi:hypothetical protein VTK73DRAFT_2723 [Phialemonium thermophilum]|uniref:Secreted protein n=1 Tax=Phialemonium thermophilum TaxID=223376 RepID=A0ABR3X3S2_9PEZI
MSRCALMERKVVVLSITCRLLYLTSDWLVETRRLVGGREGHILRRAPCVVLGRLPVQGSDTGTTGRPAPVHPLNHFCLT